MTTATVGKAQDGELRQRAAKSSGSSSGGAVDKSPTKATTTSTRSLDSNSSSISALDLLRFLAGIALASTVGSYLVTSGASYTWGLADPSVRPWFLSPAAIQRRFSGPLLLTNDQLAAYDGSDPGSPIYLALNRTIYDMSSSPHIYGPGGPYSQLAAKDASRSYITTCFDPVEDLVPYFGGVEEVYVPLWLSRRKNKEENEAADGGEAFNGMFASDMMDKIRSRVGKKKMRTLQTEAYDAALERVRDQVRTWEGMFEKKGYPIVGRVVGVDETDELKYRHLGFCDAAKKLRPPPTESLGRALELLGKDPSKMDINNLFGGVKGGAKSDGGPAKDKKKKQKKQKKSAAGKEKKGSDEGDKVEGLGGVMGDTNHAANDKANVRIEDMMKGGRFYTGGDGSPGARKVQEMLKSGPMGGDADKARHAKEALEQDKRAHGETEELRVPDAVPDAVQADL